MVKTTAAFALGLAGTAVGAPVNNKRLSIINPDLYGQDNLVGGNDFGAAAAPIEDKRVPPPEILEQIDDSSLGAYQGSSNTKRVPPPDILNQLGGPSLGAYEGGPNSKRFLGFAHPLAPSESSSGIPTGSAKRVPPPEILEQIDGPSLGAYEGTVNTKRVPPPEILEQIDGPALGAYEGSANTKRVPPPEILEQIDDSTLGAYEEKRFGPGSSLSAEDEAAVMQNLWGSSKRGIAVPPGSSSEGLPSTQLTPEQVEAMKVVRRVLYPDNMETMPTFVNDLPDDVPYVTPTAPTTTSGDATTAEKRQELDLFGYGGTQKKRLSLDRWGWGIHGDKRQEMHQFGFGIGMGGANQKRSMAPSAASGSVEAPSTEDIMASIGYKRWIAEQLLAEQENQ